MFNFASKYTENVSDDKSTQNRYNLQNMRVGIYLLFLFIYFFSCLIFALSRLKIVTHSYHLNNKKPFHSIHKSIYFEMIFFPTIYKHIHNIL